MTVETKITLRTSEADGHTHERFFEEGTIESGTYRTTEVNGHTHFFVVTEDLAPGESQTINTSPPSQGDSSAHRIVVRAVAISEADAKDHDDEEHPETTAIHNPCEEEKAREIKYRSGAVREVKQGSRNGEPVGIVSGYLATWDADTGGVFGMPDRFIRGAFTATLEDHKRRNNRQVRLKDLHHRVVGGFPLETMRQDEFGLFGIGEINLNTQLGQEAFALARQGVITDFSVGFTSLRDEFVEGERLIHEVILWEGSVVDEPANQSANILEVKRIEIEAARGMSVREIEAALLETGSFSKKAAAMLAGRMRQEQKTCYDGAEVETKLRAILADLKGAKLDLG